MKNKLLILILIFGISPYYLSAQDTDDKPVKPTWGLKADMNMSAFIVSGVSEVDSKIGIGATLGGFLNLELSKHFVLQGELLYHYKTSELNRKDLNGDYQYLGMEIPIYAIYQRKVNKNSKVYVGIGPYAEFGFYSKLKRGGEKIDLYEKDETTEVSAMLDFNSGFGVLAGYEFANGIQLNAGYKISITNIQDANSSIIQMYPYAISLGVGYRFR